MGAPTAQAADGAKLVLVLDSSGSMKEKVGGDRKIDLAKSALKDVVRKLPAASQVGLRVYGATVFDRSDQGACTDSQLVVPIGTGNRAALLAQIAKYKPYGETPISYSIKQAARDLGSTGQRTIVLVSDGEETCDVDPCLTAATLAKQGIDLRIDVIGLRVTGKARSQLKCVADRGNGSYYDADNKQQIEESLDKLSTRAFRPFRFTGTPIAGSTKKATPPAAPAGQYVDTFPAEKSELYYRLPRSIPGSTIHAGVTTIARNGDIATLFARVYDAKGGQCTSVMDQEIAIVGSRPLVSAEASSWVNNQESACNTDDSLLLSLNGHDLQGKKFELVVTEEAPLVSLRQLLPAATTMTWQSMKNAGPKAKAPAAGTSISDAPVLRPGVYTASILTGENQVFAVETDWGQRLQVQAVVAPRHGALARLLGVSESLGLKLIGPLRGTYGFYTIRGKPVSDTNMASDQNTFSVSDGTPTVRYLNRTSAPIAPADVPGLQYIELNMASAVDARPALVPYTLTVAVIGTAGEGKPDYVEQATPTPSPTATPEPTPATTPTTTSKTTPPSSSSPADHVSLGAVVVISAAAIALGVGGTVAVSAARRRRRRRP